MKIFATLFTALLLAPLAALQAVEVLDLRCDYKTNPVGIDAEKPGLSWRIETGNLKLETRDLGEKTRGIKQTAYQVLVASSEVLLNKDEGDLWDSGKVVSDQSIAVRYNGKPLVSENRYWWKVRIDDNNGRPSAWSGTAMFMTGKIRPDDWCGKWIGADLAPRGASGQDVALGFAIEVKRADEVHWVQVDLGKAQRLDRIVLHPMHHNDPSAGGWIKGYGFPLRFRIEVSDDATFATKEMVADFTRQDYANPGWVPVEFEAQGRTARYVRLTVAKMWARGPRLPFAFTLGELQVFSGTNNIAAGVVVDASASVEGYGWSETQLTDGRALAPPTGAVSPVKPEHTHGAIYLRKEFDLAKPVLRAVLSFSGLGFSEVAIDGRKVGDYVIGPGFTDYDHRVQYLSFDVSDRFTTPGQKRIDVTLADGWYALSKDPWVHQLEKKPYVDLPKLLLDLRLIHADGSETLVSSDKSWKWSSGEITRSWIAGEDIDLRLASEDARKWQPVIPVSAPKGRLQHQRETFNRIVEEIKPVSMKYDPVSKSCVWDLGRTINGWVRFKAKGPSGTQMRITTITSVMGGAGAPSPKNWTSLFTLAGSGRNEVYEPRFFHTGMRHVEIAGLFSEPALTDLVGCQVSSMQTPAGGFRCSDETVTAIHDSVRRTVVSYTTFLPNDPMREWKAWTQDIQSMFGSAFYLFAESQAMYERWQHDLLDSQRPDGNMANVAPGPVFDPYNSPWWGGCGVWLPWEWRLAYGDESLLKESYPAMKRYVDFLAAEAAKANGLQTWGLLDWLAIEETPIALINTPAHYHFAMIVSWTAERLGLPDDAKKYTAMAEGVKDTLNKAFLDPATGIYGEKGWKIRKGNCDVLGGLERLHSVWWDGDRPCTQAGQVMPLALGMVPDAARPAVEAALLREIAAHKERLSTGFVSTPYLLDILMDLAPEVGWRLTTTHEFPSWYGMTLGSGNDLMKETWSGGAAIMPSLGGNFARWCYRGLGGIRPDEAGPGFKKIMIKPAIVGDLKWVECWHDSNYGRIVSNWKRETGNSKLETRNLKLGTVRITMVVTIPPNTTATVYVPTRDAAAVTEGGKTIDKAEGVKFLRMENNVAVYAVGSGTYRFESLLPAEIGQGRNK
jgi:alpha-L-rhamnosidase